MSSTLQEELRGTPAAPVLLGVDTLRLAWASSGSAQRETSPFKYVASSLKTVSCKRVISSHLSDSVGQDLDDLVVRRGDDALPVDFNDAMPDADASSLCDTATHQTADLQPGRRILCQSTAENRSTNCERETNPSPNGT